ncbi:hypothetical protein [Neoaquamicrobium sediminum]|uniref:hypothetical protein n=1 Tax=Neoaquamicrobium sediminum TaxID=1849104 RepID=UPI003BAAC9BD
MTEDRIESTASLELEVARDILRDFLHEFGQTPFHALRWSTSTFEAAANQAVWKDVLEMMKRGLPPEAIVDELDSHIREAAAFGDRNASLTSLLVQQLHLAALVKIRGKLAGLKSPSSHGNDERYDTGRRQRSEDQRDAVDPEPRA